jgi:membrane protease subunit HflK
VDFVTKYMIIDAKKFLFSISDSETILKNVAAASLIHAIAKLPVDEILTYGKKGIETSLRDEIQQRLDEADCGIGVSFVELKDISPPGIVQRYFDDVINAGIDRKKMVHQAESYSSERLAAAHAEAEERRQQALAYRKEKIDRAEGDASRFLSQLRELGGSGAVTKKRLYLEFVQSLYPKLEKMIIVDAKKNRRLIDLKVFPGRKAMELLYDSESSPYGSDSAPYGLDDPLPDETLPLDRRESE